MIEVKRNCSSSIRRSEDKITFGSFTITIANQDYERFSKILDKYNDPTIALKIVLGIGIDEEYEIGKDFYDDPEASE